MNFSFAKIFFLCLLLVQVGLSKVGLSKENWLHFSTDFFTIYYEKKNHSIASFIANISDDILENMNHYPIKNSQKIQLILYEDLFSNGYAQASQNRMAVWISKWDNPLRGQHQWLQNVFTHELAHLLSIRQAKLIPPSLFGISLNYIDYFNERNQFQFQTLIPFGLQPHWFNEGIAQYESARLGYDSWDSHRDMLLRVSSLNDSLLSYSQMGVFAGKPLNYELGPYTQGFSFINFLSQQYGDNFLTQLWKTSNKFPFFTLSSLLKSKTGYSGEELWQQWKKQTDHHYQTVKENLNILVTGDKITHHNSYNMYPAWSEQPSGIYFISNYHTKHSRSLHFVEIFSKNPLEKEQVKIKWIDSKIKSSFTMQHRSIIYSAPDSSLILKSASIDTMQNMSNHHAISLFSNSLQPHYHTNSIVFIREYQTRFLLYQAKLDTNGKLDSSSIALVFPTDLDSIPIGFKVSNPKYSPNGTKILFSYFDGSFTKIGLFDLSTNTFKILLSKPGIDFLNPEWLKNETDFIFSSNYKNGIYNLYLYQKQKINPLTNVIGGAFQPSFNRQTNQIVYVGYDHDGFSLYLLDSLKTLAPPEKISLSLGTPVFSQPQHFLKNKESFASMSSVTESKPYMGLQEIGRPIFQPMLSVQERSSSNKSGTSGNPVLLLGLNTVWSDPFNNHSLSLSFLLEANTPIGSYFQQRGGIVAPKKDYDIFLYYQNQANTLIFNLSFLFQNINSFDTITNRSQGSEIKRISNNAQSSTITQVEIKYPFHKKSLLSTANEHYLGLQLTQKSLYFNFYEIPFKINSFNDLYTSFFWSFHSLKTTISPLTPTGLFILTNYSWHLSDLIRGSNSFRDNFYIDKNGLLKESFKKYRLQKWSSFISFAIELPWLSHHTLKISNRIESLLSWSLTNSEKENDSLNSFFKQALDVRGLPLLQNTENFFQQGRNSFRFAVDYFFPLWKNINNGLNPLFIQDIFMQGFAETGSVWEHEIWNIPSLSLPNWIYSYGWGVTMNSIFYYNIPLDFYFQSASIFNRSRFHLPYLKIVGVNTYATEIKWGIRLGIYTPTTFGNKPHKKTKYF